ncbi:cilia- and flagella-associated protein 74 isoform X2 [Brachyhypopomus gauderio]|uniref:cilia- and flagella-associated protein 74 isoform X2 n=1 Tax=Brachyhypopomus gauderio TaxID=698409 RepID=UPI004041B29D
MDMALVHQLTVTVTRVEVAMEGEVSEDYHETSPKETKHQLDAPTDIDTEEEEDEKEEGTPKDKDGFPLDSSVDFENLEWEMNEPGDMEVDGVERGYVDRGERGYVDTTRMFMLRKNLDELDSFYKQKELNVLKAREELKLCRLRLAELDKKRDSLEKDLEAEDSVALPRLHAQHQLLCVELQAEEELKEYLAMVLQEHELELCEVEVELGRFLSLRREVEQAEESFQAQKQEQYNQRVQREKAVTRGGRLRSLRAKREQEKTLREQEVLDQKRSSQAQAGQKKAAFFLRQTLGRVRQKEAEREAKRKELMMKRIEAAASLKANIAATQETMHVKQAEEKARLRKKREDEERWRESLQEAGLNSTKLMHQHKAQEDLRRKQEELRERQKARRVEIVSRLLLEEEKKERLERRRAPLRPSDPTRWGHRLLQSTLVPSPPPPAHHQVRREGRGAPSSSSSSLDSAEEETPDQGGEEEEQGVEPECLVQPEFTGLWNRKPSDYTSVPDEDEEGLLEESLKSTKTGLAKNHTSKAAKISAAGKVLKHPPFVSKPETILFKDFDLGRTYKKKVILTNACHTTNYCRFLGVSQNLLEFISVSFMPPGPLSAGMSCELEAVFRPLLNEDLDGSIQLQSANGPFYVTVKCTRKRCEMVVDSSLIDFGTHVVGETISRVITLTNRGALGTRYALSPLSSDCPFLHHLSQHSCVSTQAPDESGTTVGNPGSEAVQPDQESTEHISHTEVKSGFEATGDEEGSGSVGSEGGVTVGEQDRVFQPSEISIGAAHEGDVGPFTSVKVPVVFTPTLPGETRLDVRITFSQAECQAIVVLVRGVAESIPVWVTQPSVDLRICMYDRLYQDCIEVQSRASTALRVTFEVCKEMKNHIDILPKTGYVQAKSKFRAQLKFLPRRSLPGDAKFFFDQDTGVLEVPLTVHVADQARPVRVPVHAVVTTSDLEFDCTQVDFGHCSVFESVRAGVRLSNRSLLPQDFGFVRIPKFIDVQPNDGFGTLLPHQTLDIDLIFSAEKAGEYNFQLTCKSGINRVFLLACRAIGVRPSLEFSSSLVRFGATAVGDRSTAVLFVLNAHASRSEISQAASRDSRGPAPPVGPRLFSFVPPENSDITVTPTRGRVLPGQKCLVQVTFSPSLSDDAIRSEVVRLACRSAEQELEKTNGSMGKLTELDALTKKETQQDPRKGKNPPDRGSAKPAVKECPSKVSLAPQGDVPSRLPHPDDIHEGSEDYAHGRASLLRSFKDRFSHYVVPCYVSDADVAQQKGSEGPVYSLLCSPYNTLHLELHCPAVRPALVVTSDSGRTTLDFSQVAVGQKILKKVTIQNISSELVKLQLKSSLLDLNGPFSVQNATRALRPGDTHTLLLAFMPALAKKYRESLEVSCSHTAVELTLCGEGVAPLVTCSLEGRVMNFGHVLEKESATQRFTLQNSSSLRVWFRVVLDGPHKHTSLPLCSTSSVWPVDRGTQNYSGQPVFSVSPTEGAIGPGKTQDITVTFQPDHESLHYQDTLRVRLMNEQMVCVVELRGAAWSHTMFVCGGDALHAGPDSLLPHHIYSTGGAEDAGGEKWPNPLLLTLRSVCCEGRMSTAVCELEVGCISSTQPTAKKNMEFFWENTAALIQQGFSVEPTRGSVDAGHRRTITVTWTPPAGHTPNEVVQLCAPLTLKGDETQVYSVTLLAYVSHLTHTL